MMYVQAMLMGSVKGSWLKASSLRLTEAMPCARCEAYAWSRGSCMKNLYLGYVKNDLRYRHNVFEPICRLVRFIGREVDRHEPRAWFARLPLLRQITGCEAYEYVEVMP